MLRLQLLGQGLVLGQGQGGHRRAPQVLIDHSEAFIHTIDQSEASILIIDQSDAFILNFDQSRPLF